MAKHFSLRDELCLSEEWKFRITGQAGPTLSTIPQETEIPLCSLINFCVCL